MKSRKSLSLTLALLLTTFSASVFAVESLTDLQLRAHIEAIDDGIKSGNRNVLFALPAKGYKNGLSGVLNRFDVYPNPEYSFTSCGLADKFGKNGLSPGCRVSIKLARLRPGGVYHDIGIRIEYAIGLGESKFVPNNSAYAHHIVSGDGVLESQIEQD
ncbi:MAG: hypothetical protein NT123_02090 [Proteobacteria bacterium]|nr:hypothetical protein [Pseudomonadota bacterium]